MAQRLAVSVSLIFFTMVRDAADNPVTPGKRATAGLASTAPPNMSGRTTSLEFCSSCDNLEPGTLEAGFGAGALSDGAGVLQSGFRNMNSRRYSDQEWKAFAPAPFMVAHSLGKPPQCWLSSNNWLATKPSTREE